MRTKICKQTGHYSKSDHSTEQYEAKSLERTVSEMIETNEPISAPDAMIFTERKAGVLPEYDIRTDRFDIAIEKSTEVSNHHLKKRIAEIERREAQASGGDPAGA